VKVAVLDADATDVDPVEVATVPAERLVWAPAEHVTSDRCDSATCGGDTAGKAVPVV
jgi:hypothetical protein